MAHNEGHPAERNTSISGRRNRRNFLKLGAGVVGTGLAAGCLGGNGGGGGDGDSGGGGGTATGTASNMIGGEVHIYTNSSLDPIIQPFKDKYGVTIKQSQFKGSGGVSKYLNEREAGKANADAFFGSTINYVSGLYDKDYLVEVDVPNVPDIYREGTATELKDTYGEDAINYLFVTTHFTQGGWAYNENEIDDPPANREEAVQEKWKDQVVAGGYVMYSLLGYLEQLKGTEYAENYVEKVAALNPSWTTGMGTIASKVASAQQPLAIWLFQEFAALQRADGAPVGVTFGEDVRLHTSSGAVVDNAPNMEAAKAFIKYVLTEEAQKKLRGSYAGILPAHKDISHGNDYLAGRLEEDNPQQVPHMLDPTNVEGLNERASQLAGL